MGVAHSIWPQSRSARRSTFSTIALVAAAAAALVLGTGASSAMAQAPQRSDDPRPSLLVSYHRTGGFIGVDDRLSITSDGHVTRTDRTGATAEFDLSPAALSELQDALEAADFPSLKKVYKPPFVVSDGFDFTITSHGRTVVVFAEADIPPALAAVIDRLSQIFGAGSPI
jgi:hypothetical protein